MNERDDETLAIVRAMLGVEARASVRMSHADDEPAHCTCTSQGPERWLYEARDGKTRCSDCDRPAMPQRWEGDDS